MYREVEGGISKKQMTRRCQREVRVKARGSERSEHWTNTKGVYSFATVTPMAQTEEMHGDFGTRHRAQSRVLCRAEAVAKMERAFCDKYSEAMLRPGINGRKPLRNVVSN